MGLSSLVQYALFLLVVAVLVKPVGGYLSRVFGGENTFLDPALRPVEHLIYKLAALIPSSRWIGKDMQSPSSVLTLGTLPTDTFSFGVLLVRTALIVGALSYFAALALGPILEHLML